MFSRRGAEEAELSLCASAHKGSRPAVVRWQAELTCLESGWRCEVSFLLSVCSPRRVWNMTASDSVVNSLPSRAAAGCLGDTGGLLRPVTPGRRGVSEDPPGGGATGSKTTSGHDMAPECAAETTIYRYTLQRIVGKTLSIAGGPAPECTAEATISMPVSDTPCKELLTRRLWGSPRIEDRVTSLPLQIHVYE